MCGILACIGHYGDPVFRRKLTTAHSTLVHRGPDDLGVQELDGCFIGHTRLAIYQDAGGWQPMVHPETRLVLAYNGELYNADKLRARLQSEGYQFRTRTDTEVVLTAFAAYGPACAPLFEGMFAFVIWDPRSQTLTAARDRLGEKPLFYAAMEDGQIVVASEVKALLACGMPTDLDAGALDHFLCWKYVPADRSIYSAAKVLPPAHIVSFSPAGIRTECYWKRPEQGEKRLPQHQAVEELGRLVGGAVTRRLVGDHKVGLCLSGGIDSTLIAAYASQSPEACGPAYTVAYDLSLDEAVRASETARILGLRHRTIAMGVPNLRDLEVIAAHLDQPHADSANLAQSALCARAAEEVPVLLGGDGADELFWGYRWHVPRATPATRVAQMMLFSPAERRALLPGIPISDPVADNFLGGWDGIAAEDFGSFLSGQLLPKSDMLGMMHGVEVRAPFLDSRLITFALSLDPSLKLGPPTKPLLRGLAAAAFPHLPSSPPKHGFGAPLSAWLANAKFGSSVRDLLGPGAKIRSLLDDTAVSVQLHAAWRKLDRLSAYQIWLFLCLELWAQSWPVSSLRHQPYG